ncbi:hypothetical protein L6270_03185 [Candidatus Parcubacteria bacterium]|nr:hypothetical protein [Patescibacteria group bacterium]MBU4308968.1 hypothetical protein [Patescibacteria group bacterium]MBU4431862.1 hypothetical protein [Patescibacteria group bacterium]MBU4577328.1 hypothetical protein [Patescibacteria group bacterium]MCG2697016.1 hypothetical protein [Candidatus Parcubacteria bacterium]
MNYNSFLSNGDFVFPFEFVDYFNEHFFLWSFNKSALNLDSIIRLLIRIPNLLVFYSSNNIVVSYFYIIFCLVVGFFSFYYFLSSFLDIKRKSVIVISSLFFVFNPIFLGNSAKMGLVLAASLLPLILTLIRNFYAKKDFRFLLLSFFVLNASFIHPFTFIVNILVGGVYFIFLLMRNVDFLFKNIKKFFLFVFVGICLNFYFLIPLISVGTIDKGAILNVVSGEEINYFELVDIANADNILTSLSLTKNVFKDFDFFSQHTAGLYFFSIFFLYIVIFSPFLLANKKSNQQHRVVFVMSLLFFLLLVLLSTGTFLHIDWIIKKIISLPGGWSFRSPLKWQLYEPMLISSMLAIASSFIYSQSKKFYRGYVIIIIVLMVFINFYVCFDVTRKLLIPRHVENFSRLLSDEFYKKSFLVIEGERYQSFSKNNKDAYLELKQILSSDNVQVKSVSSSNVSKVALRNFDYLLVFDKSYNFENFVRVDEFVNGGVILLGNEKKDNRYIFVNENLYLLSDAIKKTNYPKSIGYESVNQVKKLIYIKSATQPFFITMNEGYHAQWQMEANDKNVHGFWGQWSPFVRPNKVENKYHYKLDGFLNTWYVDVPNFCRDNSACVKNNNGSYDINIVVEFWPQRWFYFGLLISSLVVLGSVVYLIYDLLKIKWRRTLR